MKFGNKLLDIKEPALEDSALAEKPHHRDSFACLDSHLKSLPGEVADLGSFSIFSISFLPQWSRSKWWSSISRTAFPSISTGVNEREVSFFSQSSVFYPLAHPFPALDVHG